LKPGMVKNIINFNTLSAVRLHESKNQIFGVA
jgi:hypothetical protein